MAETGSNPGSPHDLIRVGTTLGAIAVALAAFRPEDALTYIFLSDGLLAVVGTGYAMVALWQVSGLGVNHLLGGLPPELDLRYSALVVLTWAMIALAMTLIALLVGAVFL